MTAARSDSDDAAGGAFDGTRRFQFAAAVTALAVGGIHLWWGIPRFVAYASVGRMPDPRPLLFVLSGHAILLGVTLVAAGLLDARRTYGPGVVLALAHLVGYAAWHTVLDHGGAGATGSHHHEATTGVLGTVSHSLAEVGGHLLASPLALTAALTEVATAALLLALWRRARTDRTAVDGPSVAD